MIVRSLRLLTLLILVVVSWLLAFGNNQITSLTFLGWVTPPMPLFVWLILAVFLGIVIGLVFGRFTGRKAARK
jgi:uncharacterized integral membrane protein